MKIIITTLLFCVWESLAVDVEMFHGDSQELIFDYAVEVCEERYPLNVDNAFKDVHSMLQNASSGIVVLEDECWEGVTVEYEVTKLECMDNLQGKDLQNVHKALSNGYSDGIIAVLSSCNSARKFVDIINTNWTTRARRVVFVLPEHCRIRYANGSTEEYATTYINRELTTKNIFQSSILASAEETNEQFMTVIYDNSLDISKFEIIKVAKRLNKKGVQLQYIHYTQFLRNENFTSKWLHSVNSVTVYILCQEDTMMLILQKAKEDKVLPNTKVSWVIYNPDSIHLVQLIVQDVIKYDTRILIIEKSVFPETIDLKTLTVQVLQKKYGAFGIGSKQCLPCEGVNGYEKDKFLYGRSIRMVYNPVEYEKSRLECGVIWDLSMTKSSSSKLQNVWGPKHPRMLGINLVLSAIPSNPFVVKGYTTNSTIYEGFLVDIVNTIKSHLKFSYEIIEPEDQSYGLQVDGNFNGIIGQVQRREADLGLAQMSYLLERTRAVDYLTGYIGYKGVKMVYKNPEIEKLQFNTDWITSFTAPFQTAVWLFIVMTVAAAALSITACENFLDTRKYLNRNPRIFEFKNPFNNLFYMYSALLNQGWDMTPEAMSSRIVVIFFRFFCLFMYAGYSAVIVSQNVVTRDVVPFNTLEEVMLKDNYRIGVIRNTNFERILKNSKHGLYKVAWDRIIKYPDNIVDTAREGTHKTQEGKYVFLHDEDVVDFELTNSCDFKALDDTLLQGVNTFVVQKDSPYAAALSSHLISMHETGIIQRLRMKWWKPPKTDACNYLREGKGGAVSQTGVTLSALSMPFVLMLTGIAASFVFLTFEYQIKRIFPRFMDFKV